MPLRQTRLHAFFFSAALLLMLLPGRPLHAQGCSLCRDATAGSAPRARAGLRRAILILAFPAGGIFVATFLLARRVEQQRGR